MRKKLASKKVVLTEKDCNVQNDDFWKLYHIFKVTICLGMKMELFEAYYKSKHLEYIDISFFYVNENEIAGFCAAAFYKAEINGKQVTIARSATGILSQHRGKALGKWDLYKKYMHYKWQHPFNKLILTIYACNPFIYSMVCKYTGIVYPRVDKPVPTSVIAIKNNILKHNSLQKKESKPFVIKINFEVEKSPESKTQARESANKHVRYFVEQTNLEHRKSLLLIIPVSFKNILMCICLFIQHFLLDKKKIGSIFIATKIKKSYTLVSAYLTAKKIYANRKGMRTLP